jgi:hypothetical protein
MLLTARAAAPTVAALPQNACCMALEALETVSCDAPATHTEQMAEGGKRLPPWLRAVAVAAAQVVVVGAVESPPG